MSFQKINDLLSGGEIINYNLMSEQLKNTLVEIYHILQEQSQEITFLQKEMANRVTKNDIFTFNDEIDQKLLKNKETEEEKIYEISEKMEKVEKRVAEIDASNSDNINMLKESLTSEISAKEKDLAGDLFVLKQQICEINVKLIGHDSTIQKSQKDILKINKLLEVGKDKSLELLALRVESIENRITTMTSESTTFQNDTSQRIDDVAKFANAMKVEFTNEIHALEVGVKDVKHMVADSPVIDTDGPIDTPSLIRAIQRDSRRIDNFNETINSVRDDQKVLHALFTSISKGFNEFQMNVAYIVNDSNSIRKEVDRKTDDNEKKVLNVSKEVVRLYNYFHTSIESFMGGLTQTSKVVAQMTEFLSKMTSRQVPHFLNFDDCLLELQQQSDIVALQNEKYEEKVNNEEKELNTQIQCTREFKLPVNVINTPKDKTNGDIELIAINSVTDIVSEHPSSTSSTPAMEMFSGHSVQEMQFKIDTISNDLEHLKSLFEEKLEKKADTAVMERFIDRNRLSINRLREKVNEVVNDISNCVKRNEMKSLMVRNDSINQSDLSALIPEKPCTAIYPHRAQKTIPRVKRNIGTSHNVIYGCETPQKRPLMPFDGKRTI